MAVAAPLSANAGLGAPETSAAADAAQLKGSITATEHALYRVNEIRLPSGTLLREFATPAGSVFAVAWSGPVIPNLRLALGTYFDTFAAAAREPHAGHHHLRVDQAAFVMQSNGHMRAFSGHAYLPSKLPAGVTPVELQ